MVNDGEAGSYSRRFRHLPNDRCGQVGRALCPYLPELGVQIGQRLVGFRPRWSPSGPVGARSPVVNGLHVHAIRQSVWSGLLFLLSLHFLTLAEKWVFDELIRWVARHGHRL